MQASIISIERIEEYDSDADLSWLEQTDEQMGEGFEAHARERLATYGESWHMIGIRARATIEFEDYLQTTIESAGLWGIESDSSEDYLRTVYGDELGQLVEMLRALGFEASEILRHAPELAATDETVA